MIIVCDVDDVCADLVPAWVAKYNQDWDDNLKVDDITDWNIAAFTRPECGKKMYDYLNDGSLYDGVLPIEGALEGVIELRKYHRVVFATTAANGHAGRKLRWLRQHGFLSNERSSEMDYIEASDKSLIHGDIIVDDGAHNLRVFKGKRIQFLKPWNANEFVDGAWLACNWGEIPQIIWDIEGEMNDTFIP